MFNYRKPLFWDKGENKACFIVGRVVEEKSNVNYVFRE